MALGNRRNGTPEVVRPGEVHTDHRAEVVEPLVPRIERVGRTSDACIRDRDLDRPVLRDDVVDPRLHLRGIGHVDHCVTAGSDVGRDDPVPLVPQRLGERSTEAHCRAGDDGDARHGSAAADELESTHDLHLGGRPCIEEQLQLGDAVRVTGGEGVVERSRQHPRGRVVPRCDVVEMQ